MTTKSGQIVRRVEALLAKMTVDEKVSQMVHTSAAIPRLGIPEYNWWNECLHGVARAGRATVFPQSIGMAASFDDALLYRIGTAISDEARVKFHQAGNLGNRGQYFGLTFWTPNINLFRDPRWDAVRKLTANARIDRPYGRGVDQRSAGQRCELP